ncbi:MAG: CPXCG motif-containing cysteine-rich protein [Planctomycetaceae bacterium]|nr:CPXCG motif-containing cysteine-rich protein [Planctomycetaceae bacterium]
MDQEAEYTCGHCGETIVVPVDLSGGERQDYVEDCPVCCSPNLLHLRVEDDQVDLWAEPE